MKLVPIAIAAALVCGSAMAQAPDSAQRAENRAKAGNVADKTVDGAKRAGQATKRGVARAGEAVGNVARSAAAKVRNTGEAISRKLPPAPGERGMANDTSSRSAMGASGTANSAAPDDRGDSGRRSRMDDAYANWQRQQGSR
jgi:hypothetical protein